MNHLLHRLELLCVSIATTVASGTFKGINDRLSEIVGIPIERLGVWADLGAGILAFYGWYKHRKEAKDGHSAQH
jgi:hypothetical protein